MDTEKNKPSVPHLVESLKNNYETNGNELHLAIKQIIAKNQELIEKNREILQR
ncbi:hypothetical protein R4Z10_08945 [Niallia sp. XMNu-256]|uniref:hypothetical protein n=1 Tax=Niallia sp. XMNu-256 TaxID=3082444 RepID=UPI0030D40658